MLVGWLGRILALPGPVRRIGRKMKVGEPPCYTVLFVLFINSQIKLVVYRQNSLKLRYKNAVASLISCDRTHIHAVRRASL